MDSTSIAAVIAAVGAIVAAAIAARVTSRLAKHAQERTDSVTAAGLYTQLAQDQRTDIKDLRVRVTTLEATVTSLQGLIAALRMRARAHIKWDEELVASYNSNVPGAHVRPAPPLLEEDD